MFKIHSIRYLWFLGVGVLCAAQSYKEQYRPQYHFTPAKNWMNDPNGMVYHKGIYHLYFQYNPTGSDWGNISWGHASSKDLLHWTEHPVALEYRKDAGGNGYEQIFSGSAVVDTNNTSGFGTAANPPLVAIYTSAYVQNYTLPSGKKVTNGQQSQSIAYSLDDGLTWTTYDSQNPVIQFAPAQYLSADTTNNFRDPTVFWHAGKQHWVMVVALPNVHKLLIYTSNDLKSWTHVSEFGPANAISGQWECPGIFPLPVDDNTNNVKWVAQISLNPGGPNIGSGTMYIVGSFDGITFTADSDSVYEPVGEPKGSVVIQDFESSTWEAIHWTATGGFVGKGPIPGGDAGNHLVDTLFDGDFVTGTATSPAFVINQAFINFRIAGGYHPHNPLTYGTANDTECALNLKVNGKVVRTTTGQNAGTLAWQGWDVTSLIGQTAVIEVADFATGGWGHIILDDIVFSDSLAQEQKANWVDLGPDYYAAATFNGLPEYERIAVGWASNWEYSGDIPTDPWRSSSSIMRKYSLATINSKVTLVQTPYSMAPLEQSCATYTQSWAILPGPKLNIPVTGKSLDVTLTFQVVPQHQINSTVPKPTSVPGDSAIRFLVRSNKDGSQGTVIGYDASTQRVFVDRTNSGDSSFSSVFAGIYYATLKPDAQGKVTLRVLLDWSSVEVFGGRGESVITAQIFPSDVNQSMSLLSDVDAFKSVSITIKNVASSWSS